MLSRVVGATGSISGGVVLTLEGKTATTAEGLGVVDSLLTMVSRTCVSQSSPSDEDVERVKAYLCRLIRRYGTLRRSLESIAVGRRRHTAVSAEHAAGWVEAMSVTSGAIRQTLGRHASVMQAINDWLAHEGENAGEDLRAFERWLDGPLPEFEDEEQRAGRGEVEESGVAERGSSAGKEGSGRVGPMLHGKHVIERSSAGSEDAEPAFSVEATSDATPSGRVGPDGAHPFVGRGWGDVIADGLSHRMRLRDADAELLWTSVFDNKPLIDHAEERRLTSEQLAAAERLSLKQEPFFRTIAAIAMRDFGKADSFLPHLGNEVDEETLSMLRGHRYELEGRYDEALESFREARPDAEDPAGQRAIAAALLRARRGSRKARVGEAVRSLRGLLATLPEGSVDAARTQAMLAFALADSPSGTRADNLRQAIDLYSQALRVITKDDAPGWWAEINHMLGCALLACPKTPRSEAVPRAIECFEGALTVWTRVEHPACWASVQFSLGAAWERNPSGEQGSNLEHAISCYTAVLGVRTREGNPIGWAKTQHALGCAWLAYSGGDHRQNVERSIAALTAALEIWARESRRTEWASVQNSLGTAWTVMPTTDRVERRANLERAVRAFNAALDVRTRDRSPEDWASTQHNLGNALLSLAQQSEGGAAADGSLVKHAIDRFKEALTVRTRGHKPVEWAKTLASLGNAYMVVPVKDRNAAFSRAAEVFRQALGVFQTVGDTRNAAYVRKLFDEARSRLGGGELALADDEVGEMPRRERKLAERRDGVDGDADLAEPA